MQTQQLFLLLQGYYCRARVLKKYAQANVQIANPMYSQCIEDFIKSYNLSDQIMHICQAILTAVDQGNYLIIP